ncbi:DUF4936 family protein [Undibacterium oligocarboniphilum]|uniref:DUF4936 family protein n=1 Tax=Undibacterium oligocarboniphilum TaxID=666702 RepID=A0A850QBI4_9BURK|nr:DUF4936 family protein [Undibacterium oligocarboniphilum]MBC3868649.1 DUF4936 family protein [Undibacterium oligocarboniphilum]NVO76629.1 DUF4936 family protein [Undibacterium oligocarboniphilum]
MMNCYIYFKADSSLEADILKAEKQLQQLLMSQHQIRSRVQRRPAATGEPHTWMEVYHDVPVGFDNLLNRVLEQTLFADLQYSERHIEYFLDVDVCA